jgi:hypothetical protein
MKALNLATIDRAVDASQGSLPCDRAVYQGVVSPRVRRGDRMGRYGSAFLVYELLHAWGPVAESFRARVITPLRQQRKAPRREAHGDETGHQRTEGESARAAAPARGAATMCRARRGG